MTGSGITGILGLFTAVIAVFSGVMAARGKSVPWWPTITAGCLSIGWAIISVPIAAGKVAHRERLARLAAEAASRSKKPAADVKGSIELLEATGWQFEGHITSTSLLVWMRLVNAGDPSSLLNWRVQIKDTSGASAECSVPYHQDRMPLRSGPPFKSIHDLQNTKLETGLAAEVVIGFQLKYPLSALDVKTLCVSFVDAWSNEFKVRPAEDMTVRHEVGN